MWNSPLTEEGYFSDMERFEIKQYDSNDKLPPKHIASKQSMSYIRFATNNLESVLADKQGARCYFCLGHPNIDRFVETVDFSTILCPECGIDAVVPASVVPNDTTLKQWHDRSFG